MLRRLSILAVPAGVILTASFASAAIVETESNNTMGSANILVRPPVVSADTGVLSLGSETDVDVFQINLLAGDVLSVQTTPLAVPFTVPDTQIALGNAAGEVVEFGDDHDDSDSFGSAFDFLAPADGIYFIGITGWNDLDDTNLELGASFASVLNGLNADSSAHGETGDYLLTVTVVPVPEPAFAGLAALGLGGLAMRRRR